MELIRALDISVFGLSVLGVLALLSLAATAIVLYKLVQFQRLGVGRSARALRVLELWLAGDGLGALAGSEARDTVALRVLNALLTGLRQPPHDSALAQARAVQAAQEELARMGRYMRGLDAVVQAAPMVGLLGTVIGMIEAFGRLAQATGAVDPALLAGGIWTALITTAVGLSIAILFYFIAVWLEARIARQREALESLIAAVLNARAPQAAPHVTYPPQPQPAPGPSGAMR